MTVGGIDALLRSLRVWMEANLDRPVRFERADDAVPPALLIDLWAHTSPDVTSMSGTVARKVGVTFTSVGRSQVDAGWLDDRVMALLSGALPTGLEVEILLIQPEPGAALEVGEGRMLAAHRAAIAYR